MALNTEKIVMDWLNQDEELKAKGWTASFDVPADSSAAKPTRFITVERVGGAEDTFASRPLIAVQVWAETRWMASEAAARLVLPRLDRLIEVDDVCDVSVTGMTHFPMPDGRPRYQILIQVDARRVD